MSSGCIRGVNLSYSRRLSGFELSFMELDNCLLTPLAVAKSLDAGLRCARCRSDTDKSDCEDAS